MFPARCARVRPAAALLLAAATLAAGCSAPAGSDEADPLTVLAPPGAGSARVDPAASPVNANGTLLLARRGDAWLLLDAATGAPREAAIPASAREAKWSPLDANSAYYLEANEIHRYDVRRAESTRIGVYENYTRVATGGRGDVVLLPDGHIALALLAERADGAQDLLLLSIRERATFGRETVSSRAWTLTPPATSALVSPTGLVLAFGNGTRAFTLAGERSFTRADEALDACLVRGREGWLYARDGGLVVEHVARGLLARVHDAPALAASCRSVDAEGIALVHDASGLVAVALDEPRASWRIVEGAVESPAPTRALDAVFFTRDGALVRADLDEETRAAIAARVLG